MAVAFPFSAVVGQQALKTALMVVAVDPSIGGVLAFGDRGTGKTTTIRAMAALLPALPAVDGCPYGCGLDAPPGLCEACDAPDPKLIMRPVPVVDLPLGATEDRVLGALDLEHALATGEKRFEPGLLARAHQGFLYIDEVNLLEDHLVDLLLDVAASGENVVEREGLSVRHPAKVVLIGSGNPEEGELRPQLMDRFGLSVEVRTPTDIADRIEAVRRREAFEADPAAFAAAWAEAEAAQAAAIVAARAALPDVTVDDASREAVARLCLALGTDGLRGELTLMRAARSLAALEGQGAVDTALLARLAPLALGHRLRRNPLDDSAAADRVVRAVHEVLGPAEPEGSADPAGARGADPAAPMPGSVPKPVPEPNSAAESAGVASVPA
ncbi:MAG: magnesium chelatase ATPase subunit I [Pseudomonadota bacterium]